jgi:tRNA CCA-adding enzyme
MNKINEILKKEAEKISPEKSTLVELNKITKEFVEKLEKEIKKRKTKADVFVGGSFAKNTVIKKKKYDIDIYVRFDKKYNDREISEILKKIIGNGKRIHGSRDYFEVKAGKNIYFEVIPIIKISSPEKARNVTDLSPMHVKYVNKKMEKNKNLGNEIRLAKTFCYCQNVYGAESYIRGFSGYAIELLICYYRSFLNFIEKTTQKNRRIVLDPEKHYKNKKQILLEINESKLQSPVILIDPTFRQRNALAALSQETYEKFREAAIKFLKKPSHDYFEKKEFDEKEFKRKIKKTEEFLKIRAVTDRQSGDIAGSKLHKFYKLFEKKLEDNFEINNSYFVYDDKQTAYFYFILKKKKSILIKGPPVTAVENVVRFKKKHKSAFIKNHTVYSREKPEKIREFVSEFKKKNRNRMKEMGIVLFR